MFRIRHLLLPLLFIAGCSQYSGPQFDIDPERARPGESVTITYDPSQTLIGDVDSVKAFLMLFGQDKYRMHEVEMTPARGVFTLKYAVPDTLSGILAWFKGNNGVIDRNEARGYPVEFVRASGEKNPAFRGELAGAYMGVSPFLGIEMPGDTLLRWVETSLEADPSTAKILFRTYHNVTEYMMADSAAKARKNALRESFMNGASLSELPQPLLESMADQFRATSDSVQKRMVVEQLQTRFPDSQVLAREFMYGVNKLTRQQDMIAYADSMYARFPAYTNYLAAVFDKAVNAMAQTGAYDSIAALANSGRAFNAQALNTMIRVLRKKDPLMALEPANLLVDHAEEQFQPEIRAKAAELSYLAPSEVLGNREYQLANAYNMKAELLAEAGDTTRAAEWLTKSFGLRAKQSSDANAKYARILAATEFGPDYLERLSGFVRGNSHNEVVDSLLQIAYEKHGPIDDRSFEDYYDDLLQDAQQEMMSALRGKITDLPAENFELLDTQGQTVHLDDYRGKVVVLDFWATWCGPCIQSFPGMQQNMKETDPEKVHFLYVHTSEPTDDPAKTARDFMEKNGYDEFHTVIDADEAVKIAYGVQGLPTKIVVGPTGRVRFKSLGFNSNLEYARKELLGMIEMAGAPSP